MDQIDFTSVFKENFANLIKLLEIPSVYDEKTVTKEMPYGKNVAEALDFFSSLALKDGFNVEKFAGYATRISLLGDNKRIDIPCHLDVVAAKEEDFKIFIENNKLVGRGTSDMKGPTFLVYLALKLLKKNYPKLKNTISIVLGTDEERTMDDMRYYLSNTTSPDFAFTPDGYFPIGIGEKGAIMWTIKGKYEGSVIESLFGGSQCNIVSPFAKATIKAKNISELESYIKNNHYNAQLKLSNEKINIEVIGKAAHASVPFLGHSATIDLLKILSDVYHDELAEQLYSNYANYYGQGIDCYVSDDLKNSLTINLGILNIDNNTVFGQVDCRYPFGENAENLTNNLLKHSPLDVSLDYNDEPTLCDENDIYVKTMLDTYRTITKDDSPTFVSGGVSYAKVFKHCVSFGPVNPFKETSTAHQDGEYIYLNDAIKWLEIYYEVMKKLAFLEV